jgi:hypothetical protein
VVGECLELVVSEVQLERAHDVVDDGCASSVPSSNRLRPPASLSEVWQILGQTGTRLTEMRIRFGPGREHDSTVTASLVRNLPLGTMIEESRRALIAKATLAGDEPSAVPNQMWAKFAGVGPHRGTEITAEQDQAAADVYRQAWGNGKPVTAAVAEHFSISKSAANKRIAKARAAGLLKGMGPKR